MKKPLFKFALKESLKNDNSFLPVKADEDATGWDVSAAFENDSNLITLNPKDWIKIPLGFRCFAPKGWWLELRPRSSTTAKKNIHCLYGVVDETYEGMMFFCGQYLPKDDSQLVIEFGEKIGQLVPVKRQEMDTESISNEEFDELCKKRQGKRGEGGFGSTSK